MIFEINTMLLRLNDTSYSAVVNKPLKCFIEICQEHHECKSPKEYVFNLKNDYDIKYYTMKKVKMNNLLIALKIYGEFGLSYVNKSFNIKCDFFDIYKYYPTKKIKLKYLKLLIQRRSKKLSIDLGSIQNLYQNICHNIRCRKKIIQDLDKSLQTRSVTDMVITPNFQVIPIYKNDHLKYEYSIDVTIEKDYIAKIIHINESNIDQSCEIIIKSLTNNNMITLYINNLINDNRYGLLCQKVACNLMLKIKHGLSYFFRSLSFKNDNIMLKVTTLFLRNPSIMKNIIMNDPTIWRTLFDSWNQALMNIDNHDMQTIVEIFKVYILTLSYWTVDQACYAYESGFLDTLAFTFRTCYLHSSRFRQYNVKSFVIEIVITLDILNIYGYMRHNIANIFVFDYLKKVKLNNRMDVAQYQNYNYHVSHVTQYLMKYIKRNPHTFKQLSFMRSIKSHKIKVCGNNKCVISKNKANVKLKICKGCKVFYFCCRKCQKIAWREQHGNICAKLAKQIIT